MIPKKLQLLKVSSNKPLISFHSVRFTLKKIVMLLYTHVYVALIYFVLYNLIYQLDKWY